MSDAPACGRRIRFGPYYADLAAGELRKNGRLKVLALSLARPGEVVTRDELRERLWAGDTFVDFDQGLNTAISKRREALGDATANPRFVETVPRRGYRFRFPLETPPDAAAALDTLVPVGAAKAGRKWPRWLEATWIWQAAAGFYLILAVAFALLWLRQPAPETHAAQFHIEPPAETRFTALHSGTAISLDGQRFLIEEAAAPASSSWLTIILNWQAGMKSDL